MAETFESWLQSRLTAHGFPIPVDGKVGPLTVAAIKAFETAHGIIPADGIADEKVVALLRTSSTALGTVIDPISERNIRLPASANPKKLKAVWPRQHEVRDFYGDVGTSQAMLDLPFPLKLAWDKSKTVKRMSLHKKVLDSAGRAFAAIDSAYSPSEISRLGLDIFGGSLNVRRMRGGSSYSMHSWGIAIDIDPERNQLKWDRTRAKLAHEDVLPFWEAWEDEGWLSLGRARNFDWMHVQAARL